MNPAAVFTWLLIVPTVLRAPGRKPLPEGEPSLLHRRVFGAEHVAGNVCLVPWWAPMATVFPGAIVFVLV